MICTDSGFVQMLLRTRRWPVVLGHLVESCGVPVPILGGEPGGLLADFQAVCSDGDELKASAAHKIVGWR